MIAVAAAHITRCPYCIEGHTKKARQAGATDQEIGEAIFVAMAMSAGASLAHATIAMESTGKIIFSISSYKGLVGPGPGSDLAARQPGTDPVQSPPDY